MKKFDGHFWVERDGEVIDFDFDDYKMIGLIQNCDASIKKYVKAPPLVQKVMVAMVEKHFTDDLVKYWVPMAGYCYFNAFVESLRNGGNVVFGSLGFKFNDSDDYHFEFGGEDWVALKQFLL